MQWKSLRSCCKKKLSNTLPSRKRIDKKDSGKIFWFHLIFLKKCLCFFSSALVGLRERFHLCKTKYKIIWEASSRSILILVKINVSVKINWTLPSVFQAYHRSHLVEEKYFLLFYRKKSRSENQINPENFSTIWSALLLISESGNNSVLQCLNMRGNNIVSSGAFQGWDTQQCMYS